MPLAPDVHEEMEAVLRARLLDLVAAGTDVVLDFSSWSRRMRDDYRLDEEHAARHFDHFEVPSPEEGRLTVVR